MRRRVLLFSWCYVADCGALGYFCARIEDGSRKSSDCDSIYSFTYAYEVIILVIHNFGVHTRGAGIPLSWLRRLCNTKSLNRGNPPKIGSRSALPHNDFSVFPEKREKLGILESRVTQRNQTRVFMCSYWTRVLFMARSAIIIWFDSMNWKNMTC